MRSSPHWPGWSARPTPRRPRACASYSRTSRSASMRSCNASRLSRRPSLPSSTPRSARRSCRPSGDDAPLPSPSASPRVLSPALLVPHFACETLAVEDRDAAARDLDDAPLLERREHAVHRHACGADHRGEVVLRELDLGGGAVHLGEIEERLRDAARYVQEDEILHARGRAADRPREQSQHLAHRLRRALEEREELVAADEQALAVADRHDGRGPWGVVEERELAEHLAGAEQCDDSLLAVLVRQRDLRRPRHEDIEVRGRIAAVENRLGRREAPRPHPRGERAPIRLGERGEQRHACEGLRDGGELQRAASLATPMATRSATTMAWTAPGSTRPAAPGSA